jgi:SH3-like domain-containing protein
MYGQGIFQFINGKAYCFGVNLMKPSNRICIILLFALLIQGCSLPGQPVAVPTAPAVAPSQLPTLVEKLQPTATNTPSIMPSSTPAPTSTPFVPFTASVWVDNVNVRVNPGYLFPALKLIAQGTSLTVLGKSPGGEWLYARIPDGTIGWVFTQLVQSNVDLQAAPVIEPQGVQLIKGRVVDLNGTPIQGVGFSILQGEGNQPPTNRALTDSNGEFFSFMPLSASGRWTVVHDSIACKSNVWTDDSCTYYKDPYKGIVVPQSVVATLPQSSILEFLWK